MHSHLLFGLVRFGLILVWLGRRLHSCHAIQLHSIFHSIIVPKLIFKYFVTSNQPCNDITSIHVISHRSQITVKKSRK
jgi:hypothetical protein